MGRPRIKIQTTPGQKVLEAIAAAVLLTLALYLWKLWPGIPDNVPTHFNLAGRPDRWGSGKGTLLLMPALALGMYAMFTVLGRMPHLYNYPSMLTEANAPRLYAIGVSLMIWMKAEMIVLFGVITWRQIEVATGRADGFGPWLMPIMIAVNLATVGVHLWRMRAAAK